MATATNDAVVEEEEEIESRQFIAALRNGKATIPKLAELIDLRFQSQARRFREHRQEHRDDRDERRKDRNRMMAVVAGALVASPAVVRAGLEMWEVVTR